MRYFYTDPLAAAWMAKHFGMKFVVDNKSLYAERYMLIGEYRWMFDLNHVGKAFEIHADSQHLLMPEIGDIIEFFYPGEEDKQVCIITCGKDAVVYEQGIDIDWVLGKNPMSVDALKCKIIRRNKAAFIWPEKEST